MPTTTVSKKDPKWPGHVKGSAHLLSSSLASFPRVSTSSLDLLGLMARTSSGSIIVSIGPTAAESRGTIIVPLLFLLGRPGLRGIGA